MWVREEILMANANVVVVNRCARLENTMMDLVHCVCPKDIIIIQTFELRFLSRDQNATIVRFCASAGHDAPNGDNVATHITSVSNSA